MTDDLLRRFQQDRGFAGTLAPEVLTCTTERVALRMDVGPELQQHFGGPHAAIIFGLGELASYLLLMRLVGDLVGDEVAPLVKSGSISYSAIAVGPLTATALPTSDVAAARAAFDERGGLTVATDVVFTGEDGAERSRASYRMGLKRF